MHDFSLPTLLSSLSSVTRVSSSSRGTLWYILRSAAKSLLKYTSNVSACLDNLIYPSIKTWLETITSLWVCLNLHCSGTNSFRKTKARFWFCISYFLAMMKYYDQGNLYTKEFNLTFGSRELEFIMLGQLDSTAESWQLTFWATSIKQRDWTGNGMRLFISKLMTYFLQQACTSPTVPSTRDMFKYQTLRGEHFSFKSPKVLYYLSISFNRE